MFENCKKYSLPIFTLLLFITTIFIFYQDFKNSHQQLTFAMLDIEQGDALFIESPTGTQVLVDGGPPRKILSQLSRIMSPFDKNLDAIIITNPDQDHIGGFLDVLKNYKVDMVFEPGTANDSKTFQNLKNEIKNKNVPDILVKKGMLLHLGGGAVIDILFPDRDVSMWSTNDGSIVAKLIFGDTSIMLTGDATSKTEKIVMENFPKKVLKSTILKVGHHGSRTSTSDAFTRVVMPKYALISSAQDNNYGHPHKDVLDTLANFNVEILRTDKLKTIVFSCDRMEACEIKK